MPTKDQRWIVRRSFNIVHAAWMSWRHMLQAEIEARPALRTVCQTVDDALIALDNALRKEVP
jgi:hypothetical protein